MSRRAELRLTMVPRYPKLNQVTGAKQGETKGAFIGFRDGQVRIPKDGGVRHGRHARRRRVGDDGRRRGPQVDERHRLFGNQLEGFWRVDPTAPPVSQEEMRALMNAALTSGHGDAGGDHPSGAGGVESSADRGGGGAGAEQAREIHAQADAAQREQEQMPAKAKTGPKPKAPADD
jgi:hypothetical protein